MERYFKKKSTINPTPPSSSTNNPTPPSSSTIDPTPPSSSTLQGEENVRDEQTSKRPHEESEQLDLSRKRNQSHVEVDLSNLPMDPGLRKKISEYPPNERELVRRAYLLRGPCQPKINFPTKLLGSGDENRRFVVEWYDEEEFKTWLEYSITKDAVFCLYCYLFKPQGRCQGGGDAFMVGGFSNWKKKKALRDHIGGPSSFHNEAYRKGHDLLNKKKHIETIIQRQSSQARSEYRVRLKASVDCVRFLLKQGLAFRGHNETEDSNNRGNFLELLEFSAFLNNDIANVVLQNAPENNKLTAHQLQLALVGVAKNHPRIALLFNMTSNALNIVGVSCKRRDLLREKHAAKVFEKIKSGEILSGKTNFFAMQGPHQQHKGLNQETTLKRSGDTRWGSHYGTLVSVILMYSSVIDVLEIVMNNALTSEQRGEACALLDQMQSFEFVFNLHLMKDILGISSELSKALQKEDQEIVNVMTLVKVAKQRLNEMRNHGWDSFFAEVSSFCINNDVTIPNMEDQFVERGRSRRRAEVITNSHYYRVQLFIGCVDLQFQELENRFNEVNTELLLCMACLSPRDSFVAFDKNKLIRLAQFYPRDFSTTSVVLLSNQLETYILDVRCSSTFSELRVATAGVERAFSAMNIVKTKLRNRMADEWMNDSLVAYIEKDICDSIDDETIMQRFQQMANRRGQL